MDFLRPQSLLSLAVSYIQSKTELHDGKIQVKAKQSKYPRPSVMARDLLPYSERLQCHSHPTLFPSTPPPQVIIRICFVLLHFPVMPWYHLWPPHGQGLAQEPHVLDCSLPGDGSQLGRVSGEHCGEPWPGAGRPVAPTLTAGVFVFWP